MLGVLSRVQVKFEASACRGCVPSGAGLILPRPACIWIPAIASCAVHCMQGTLQPAACRPLMQSLIQSSTRIHNVWNSSTTNTWTEAC